MFNLTGFRICGRWTILTGALAMPDQRR